MRDARWRDRIAWTAFVLAGLDPAISAREARIGRAVGTLGASRKSWPTTVPIDPDALLLLVLAPAVGSFLGTLVLRLPAGAPLLLGRSRCESCGAALTGRDLMPLLSWLIQRGRCRHCGRRLSAFYPTIELAALAVATWSLAVFPGWLAWASAALGWTLLAAAEIDRRHLWLPDVLVLPLIPAGLAVLWAAAPQQLPAALLGAVIGFVGMAGVAWLYAWLRGRAGLGLGDAKLFAAAGAWTTWAGLPSVLLLAAAGGLAAALLMAARGAPMTASTALPFGPFLAAGLWLVWSFGPITAGLG